MDLHWTDFPDAPTSGAFLCALDEIPLDGVLSKDLNGFPFLVVLVGDTPHAYVNACPHQFLPLDHRGGELLTADGVHLMCSNHSAMFRVLDGQGTSGEGVGCRLSLIPTTIIDGNICLQELG
ncbi:MAG: nitrite reductase/ring-hydroxylating ferredoxin subunit [Paracoccaceae bacterium]|jgi:nitrite reductase/ring-hydroxylating ferredoxin subunit